MKVMHFERKYSFMQFINLQQKHRALDVDLLRLTDLVGYSTVEWNLLGAFFGQRGWVSSQIRQVDSQ